jgi:hypothetical protein
MWTKQHDAFLHFDSSLKARNGNGPAFRVKFPKRNPHVLRAAAASMATHNQQRVVMTGRKLLSYGFHHEKLTLQQRMTSLYSKRRRSAQQSNHPSTMSSSLSQNERKGYFLLQQ